MLFLISLAFDIIGFLALYYAVTVGLGIPIVNMFVWIVAVSISIVAFTCSRKLMDMRE